MPSGLFKGFTVVESPAKTNTALSWKVRQESLSFSKFLSVKLLKQISNYELLICVPDTSYKGSWGTHAGGQTQGEQTLPFLGKFLL